ncbi:MAG: hypothetical protein ACRDND_23445 [Streptosporangiaceae bacterium]
MKRYDIERAVLAADLPGPSVTIMLALCTRIWRDEGIIPPDRQPSLTELARDCSLSRSTVMRHLNDPLERAGWVIRIRPPMWLARTEHVTTAYAMQVPEGYAQARRRRRRGLGADPGESGRTAEQELAARDEQARRAALHIPDESDSRRSSPDDDPDLALARIARAELAAITGRQIPMATAAEAVRLVLGGRTPRSPEAYLRRALRDKPHRFLPPDPGPPPLRDYEARVAQQIQHDREREGQS